MNEFEDKLVQSVMTGLHNFEVKMAETVAEIRGDLKALTSAVEKNTLEETGRLNTHSEILTDLNNRAIVLENWKEQQEKDKEAEDRKTGHKIAIWNTATIIIAAVLAYVLTKIG